MLTLTGPWAGVVVVGLGLLLLFAPPKYLYRKHRTVMRQSGNEPPPPRWATIFFRVLGLLLLALAAVLLWPAR